MKKLTGEWLKKAESDMASARISISKTAIEHWKQPKQNPTFAPQRGWYARYHFASSNSKYRIAIGRSGKCK